MSHFSSIVADDTRAMLDRMRAAAGVAVTPHSETKEGGHRFYGVTRDGGWYVGYMTKDEAETAADELAMELIDQGLVGEIEVEV